LAEVPGKGSGGIPIPAARARAVLDLLGLGARARALVSGTSAVRSAARDGTVRQVILAADAAPGQRSKLVPLLEARQIPYYIGFTQEELGSATGRAPVSAVGLSNAQMAERAGELIAALPRSGDHHGGD
jgi:ribosomal protein L7Ae-like RNA K-turn-binding protein